MAYEDMLVAGGAGGLLAFFAAMAVVMIVFCIAMYIYSALVLMAIAKKTNTPNGWMAWVPIANIILMLNIAGLPWYWIFAIFVGVIPFFGGLALMAGIAYVFWLIAEKRKFPGWYGILCAVPIVNLVFMGILAWTEYKK
jgi:hypothetical protein